MCVRFNEWENDIKQYCKENNLSFEKAQKMAKGSNKTTLVLQYYNPEDGKKGLIDETPMPAVLWVTKVGDKLQFEQTEYTRKYLSM